MTAYPDGFTFQEYDHARATLLRTAVEVHSVREQRVARIIAGGVGICGAAAMAASLLDVMPLSPPLVLTLSALGVPAAYVAVRGALRVARSSARGSDSARLEGWSLGLPLVAISLLAPLSLHAVVAGVIAAVGPASFAAGVEGFTSWMRMSGVIVGHAHLALAVLALRFVSKLRKRSLVELAAERAATAGVKDVLVTTAIAAVPGIVLLAIPPILVAVTGLVFVPLAYDLARRALLREREQLARFAYDADRTPDIADLEAARAELPRSGVTAALFR